MVIGFRCEDLTESESESQAIATGKVASVERLGDSAVVYFEKLNPLKRANENGANNEIVELGNGRLSETNQSEPLVARFAAATEVAPGDRLGLSVQPSRVMWFDLHSGENLLKELT